VWSLRLVCVLAAATVAGSAGAAPGGPVVVPRVPSAAGAPALVPAAPDPLDRSLAPDPLDPRDGPSTAPPSDVPLPGLGPHLARALRTAPLAPVRALARGLAPATYAALGAEVEATIGPIAALRLPARAVAERLARAGAVLERPGLLRLQLDHSREVVGADAADFADGYAEPLRGAGVMIGTYDSGIDHRHPDVRRLDGTSRVHVVWDQDAGQTCSRTVLDLGACPLGDDAGHGTHVASIALGSGPRYRGMAPDATLIAVESLLFEQLVPALAFMRSQAAAAGRPLVVNISLGGHVGAHDGTSLDAQAIDAFEHLVVVAAGNEGAAAVHAGAELDEARPVDVPLRVGGGRDHRAPRGARRVGRPHRIDHGQPGAGAQRPRGVGLHADGRGHAWPHRGDHGGRHVAR
jgi:subtilisin family serine protease